jgi:hypothetical protein
MNGTEVVPEYAAQRFVAMLSSVTSAPFFTITPTLESKYDFEKSTAQVDRLLQRMANDPKGSSAWVLWNIAILGARGVDRERIHRELLSALQAGDIWHVVARDLRFLERCFSLLVC